MRSFLELIGQRPYRYFLLIATLIFPVAAIALKFLIRTDPTKLVDTSVSTFPFLIIGGGVAAVAAMLSALFSLTSTTERISSEVKNVRRSLTEPRTPSTEAVDKKKEQFLSIPNISFHFANRDEIASFYNDYFKEPTIEQVISEITSEASGEAKAKIPQVLESRIGGKDVAKWISTIKLPDISVAEMFRRYQRETIKNGQVTLGLELVDIDLSDLNAFESLLTKLKSNFDVQPDQPQVEKQRGLLKKRAAEKTILRLENATANVLVEGKFTISELSPEFYKCTYEHPVSEYLAGEGKQISISIILRKDSIESNIAGNYAQSIGRSIPLKIYGKVWQPVDRRGDVWELQITPIAVY